MPSRPIYPDDTAVSLAANQWIPVVDPTRSPTSDQNVRVSSADFLLGQQNPVVFNWSGVPDAATVIKYVVTTPILITANPDWYAHCSVTPTAAAEFSLSVFSGGSVDAIGTIEIDTDGITVTSPAWAETELEPGDAIIVTAPNPADATMANIGLGFLAYRRVP